MVLIEIIQITVVNLFFFLYFFSGTSINQYSAVSCTISLALWGSNVNLVRIILQRFLQ